MVSLASAIRTLLAAIRISRLFFIAASISAGSSGAWKLFHQSAAGQTGAVLSTTGAVKLPGTSPGLSRATGLGVIWQPAAARAKALTDRALKIVRMKSVALSGAPRGAAGFTSPHGNPRG